MTKHTLWQKKIKTRQRLALWHLKRGGVICYQTDTIIGLGCLANYLPAIERIIALKKRAREKGLILLASCPSQLTPYVDKQITTNDFQTMANNQIRPTTWLVPAHKKIAPIIIGKHKTVAVRLTKKKTIAYFCQRTKTPLIATSANISGQKTAQTRLAIRLMFGCKIDFVLVNEQAKKNQPSQIIDFINQTIHRA